MSLGRIAARFQVQAQGAEQLLGLGLAGGLAPANRGGGQHHRQIDIESIPANLHSALNNRNESGNVKIVMSKQYNKAEKRKRREAYLKRKKAAAKAKGPGQSRAQELKRPPDRQRLSKLIHRRRGREYFRL